MQTRYGPIPVKSSEGPFGPAQLKPEFDACAAAAIAGTSVGSLPHPPPGGLQAYVVSAVGHCGECHTPRNRFGGLQKQYWLAGGANPDGEGRVPNITPHRDGLADWSARDISRYLKSGFTPEYDTVGGSMAHADPSAEYPAVAVALDAELRAVGPDGERSIDNTVFYTRLGQRIIHIMETRMALGQLYEVDMRLRPSGNSGLLVTSIGAFEGYQLEQAWTWEHQALLRARTVAGKSELRDRFDEIRLDVLRTAVRRETLREDVRVMRERMRKELSKSGPGEFDLKQDAGGVTDIEFLAQYWTLRWADRYPELVTFTDNIRQLESQLRRQKERSDEEAAGR